MTGRIALRMTGLNALRITGLAVVLFMIGTTASATTYYVSSSTGNDGNNGTASSTAWQTIGHVNAQTFLPGDSILFKRGDVWNESLTPPSSGSSGSPITFDAYGTGAAPNLTGYYAVPTTAWVLVTGNAWKAPMPATYTAINFCLFGSIWGQKVSAVSSNLTAQWDFYLANGYVYVFSVRNPATYYNEPIVPMALSNVPVINVNGKTWLTFQHFLVNWFDQYGVYVQGTSDHLVFANMEADSMIPQGTQPLGFYVNESAPGPGDIKIYNAEAHLNYDGFRFDGSATAITMVNDKGYANRDGALVDNTGAVTYSYCHFYASSLAVAGSTDVEWTSGTGPIAGPGNIAADTAAAVQVWQRYPAEVTLTVDDSGMTPGADTYYAGTVLPVADAAGVPVGAAITVGYPLANTLVSEFQGWINAGRDVTSHSISHTYYTNTDALDLQYTGSGTAATLSISSKTLTITVTGASDSVSYNLAQGQPQGTMLGLQQALAATGKYTTSYLTPCQGPYGTGCSAYTAAALLSQDLADVSGQNVKSSVYHMLLDVTRLTTDEITLSRQWMTTNLTGLPATPVYVYPGGYETTTMQGITEGVPYTGARGALKEDLGVLDTYADGFNAQNITSFGVNPSWMGITPASLNRKIQALVWKESVWGVPWGIFWHLNELTQDDPVGGTEITNLIQDFKNSGATVQTNTGLVNWLLGGTQETGTDGNDYYKRPATSMTLDFRPTKNSPVVDAGENLGAAYELDLNGVNQNSYGSGWEIGAHVYQGFAVYGGQTGSYFTVGTLETAEAELFGFTETSTAASNWPTVNYGMQRFWDSPPLQWPSINTAPGVFSFGNLDTMLAQDYSNGITQTMYTLARTPPWASSNPTDTTCAYTTGTGGGDGECDAPYDLNSDGSGTNATWKAWIAEIAGHVNATGYCTGTGATHACIKYWEIWNEPDTWTDASGRFWAGTFAQLARLTEDANCIITGRGVIHENGAAGTATPCTVTAIDATAKIVMASGHADVPALTYAQNQLYCNNTAGIASGELPCPNPANAITEAVDIINFHMKPGNETGNTCPAPTPCTPESAMQMYVANIHGILQPAELAKPLWDGEASYSTSGFTNAYTDPDMAASFMPRFYLINWSLGVSGMAWYSWDELEAEAAEVATSYQQAYNWLYGSILTSPCSANGTVWSCGILKSGQNYLILWDTSQSCSADVCTTSSQPVGPGWNYYQDMTTASTPALIVGSSVPVGIKPVVLSAASSQAPHYADKASVCLPGELTCPILQVDPSYPVLGGATGANTCFTPIDFGIPVCRLTDSTWDMTVGDGNSFVPNSADSHHEISSDKVLVAFGNSGGSFYVGNLSYSATSPYVTLSHIYTGNSSNNGWRASFSTNGGWSNNPSTPETLYLKPAGGTPQIDAYDFSNWASTSSTASPAITTLYDFRAGQTGPWGTTSSNCLPSGAVANWHSLGDPSKIPADSVFEMALATIIQVPSGTDLINVSSGSNAFTVTGTGGITALSESGSTVTVTTTNTPAAGTTIVMAGNTPAGYNGTFTVVSSNSSSFTYTDATTGLGPGTAFGTITIPLDTTGTLTDALITIDGVLNSYAVATVAAGGLSGTLTTNYAGTTGQYTMNIPSDQGTGMDIVVYVVGSGCEHLNTGTGVVTGDFGSTGSVTGTSDRFYLHGAKLTPNGAYVVMSGNVGVPGSGTTAVSPMGYAWQVGTTSVVNLCISPNDCGGHNAIGFTHIVNNGIPTPGAESRPYSSEPSYTELSADPPVPFTNCTEGQNDNHIEWTDVDPLDSWPFMVTTEATNSGAQTPGSYTCPLVNEIYAMDPATGTIFRFGHSLTTGLSPNYGVQNVISNVTDDGRYLLFPSDWNGLLGRSDLGAGTCVTSGSGASGCRADMFVVGPLF
jgi:hypothetical protein